MQIHTCVRCGHEWASRKLTKPQRCARCTRLNWWRPARIPKAKPERGPVGRPNKYQVQLLNVGQQMTIPHDGLNVVSCKNAIISYGKRNDRVFKFSNSVGGLVVRRVG